MKKLFYLILLFILNIIYINSNCHNNCNKHGTCNTDLQCECYSTFEGADCSLRSCNNDKSWSDVATETDSAHKMAECSNRGICDHSNGKCKCMDGFTGDSCQRTECPKNCNYHGVCLSMKQYAESNTDEDGNSFIYNKVWDANKLYGCLCDEGYSGPDCSKRDCPEGDDPLTIEQVNEIQYFKCNAISGSFVLYYEGISSSSINVNANEDDVEEALESISLINDIDITFSESNNGVCNSTNINIVKVEFLNNFGSLSSLIGYTNNLDASGTITISSDGKTILKDSYDNEYLSIKGTKESDICSNRGLCDNNYGVCSCYNTNGDVYASSNGEGESGILGDCGYATTTIKNCPGYISCSGHGVCNDIDDEYRCECSNGWSGGDCSERSCLKSKSWFSYPSSNNKAHDIEVVCSNMGICSKETGECECFDGFFGAACEYMKCDDNYISCNGHGECISMNELALKNTNVTYGNDPNNALTWDNNKIYGCYCDDGWEGYDCSLRSCQKGDDPNTISIIEDIECSNHGLCNHFTGTCNCFHGWSSSDGEGNEGTIPDCGYRVPQYSQLNKNIRGGH